MTAKFSVPQYSEMGREGIPEGANWGVFGAEDELGTLNFLDEECVTRAASLVKTGKVFPLGLGLNFFRPPLAGGRTNAVHHLKQFEAGFDDYYDSFYPQGTSQWDALRHYRHPKLGHYNGHAAEEITADNDLLSISRIARKGIVTRGVLADIATMRDRRGNPIDCSTDEPISLNDLEECLAEEGVSLERGDVLLLRTGWVRYYKNMVAADPDKPREAVMKFPGLSKETIVAAYLWDHQIAAIAADTYGVEAYPGGRGRPLHIQLIAYLGMPLGEQWNLDDLADYCQSTSRFEFMLTSAPLDLPGGTGSPPAALAIL